MPVRIGTCGRVPSAVSRLRFFLQKCKNFFKNDILCKNMIFDLIGNYTQRVFCLKKEFSKPKKKKNNIFETKQI